MGYFPGIYYSVMQTRIKNKQKPALTALLIQLLTLILIFPLITFYPSLNILEWAILHGSVAAILSYLLKMAVWWIPIHLCFMPAIVVMHAVGLAPIWFGLGFGLLFLIYGKTYQTQVPLYLSSNQVTNALKTLLPQKKNFTFMDLGCGCGGLLRKLSKTHANGIFHGIETALLPYFISRTRNLLINPNYKIQWGDLWKQDLSQYDIVYAYLSPTPMKSLWEKVCLEMRPGCIFISNTFIVPCVKPDKCIKLNDFTDSTLYIWRI